MAIGEDKGSQAEEARWRFLEEGAKSYVAANSALIEFRREVQTACREIFGRRLGELSNALGLVLDSGNIVEWSSPSESSWSGIDAGLGVKIAFSKSPELSGWLYCGFYWDYQGSETPWFGPYNGIWLNRRSSAEALLAAFQEVLISGLGQEANDVWLAKALAASEAPSFCDKLAESLVVWIDCWKRIGGFKAIGC